MIITIDGPVASGKTVIGTKIAHKFGLFYLNSGLLFRALAYILFEIKKMRVEKIALLQKSTIESYCVELGLQYRFCNDSGPMILCNGIDVTPKLVTEQIGAYASKTAIFPSIRDIVMDLQKLLVEENQNEAIVDGRDAGTKVFPDADLKIFITASVSERAKRVQMRSRIPFKDALEFVSERDTSDINRSISPLLPAQDAIVIDSTDLQLEQVFDKICAYILQVSK